MQQKAESQANLQMNKVHVFDPVSGNLNAYYVIHDFDTLQNFSTLVPTPIASSPRQLASVGHKQQQISNWLHRDSCFTQRAQESFTALKALMGTAMVEVPFTVQFADNGRAAFVVTGIDESHRAPVMELTFDSAEDGFSNVIPKTKSRWKGSTKWQEANMATQGLWQTR